LLFPFVQSAEEARRAVAAIALSAGRDSRRRRGLARTRYGRIPDYFKRAAEQNSASSSRSRPARRSLHREIAAVEGVDGVFIGPATCRGFRPSNNWQRPEIWSAIIDAGQKIHRPENRQASVRAEED